MKSEKLNIYVIDANGEKRTFPLERLAVEINEWSYSAERMGNFPSITAKFSHIDYLGEEEWSGNEFIELNGCKFFAKQPPIPSKNNEDIRYTYDIEFVSDKEKLNHVLFFDCVTERTQFQFKDRYRTNNTTFSFYGELNEAVDRLNDSLYYSGLYDNNAESGFKFVLDDGIESETKEVSFENVYIKDAIEQISDSFNVPYYWEGNVCHFGSYANKVEIPLEYGKDKGLLGITISPNDDEVITKITGQGSTENIPFYYPNLNQYGNPLFKTEDGDGGDGYMDGKIDIDPDVLEFQRKEKKYSYPIRIALCRYDGNVVDTKSWLKVWCGLPFGEDSREIKDSFHNNTSVVFPKEYIQESTEKDSNMVYISSQGVSGSTSDSTTDGRVNTTSVNTNKTRVMSVGFLLSWDKSFQNKRNVVEYTFYHNAFSFNCCKGEKIGFSNLNISIDKDNNNWKWIKNPILGDGKFLESETSALNTDDSVARMRNAYYYETVNDQQVLRVHCGGIKMYDPKILNTTVYYGLQKDMIGGFDRSKCKHIGVYSGINNTVEIEEDGKYIFVYEVSVEFSYMLTYTFPQTFCEIYNDLVPNKLEQAVISVDIKLDVVHWINRHFFPSNSSFYNKDYLYGLFYHYIHIPAIPDMGISEKDFYDFLFCEPLEKHGITFSDNLPSHYAATLQKKFDYDVNKLQFVDDFEKIENLDGAPKIIFDGEYERIQTSTALMPSIYYESKGAERFFKAQNNTHKDEEGNYLVFENEFDEKFPREYFYTDEEIKPSIREIKNKEGHYIGEIADIAFDEKDSDITRNTSNGDKEYVHSYFYIKLRKFDGDYWFNIFTNALENGTMTINMVSGNCNGCSFEINGSQPRNVNGKYVFDNFVQTTDKGKLVKSTNVKDTDEGYYGDYFGNEALTWQQDTTKNEVWIAVKKDLNTFGVIMPNATNNYRPQIGDKFVITNVKFPVQYLREAEKRLDASLLNYMFENNAFGSDFSVNLSRIYLEQHKELADSLTENSLVTIRHNGIDREFFISSINIKNGSDVLQEVSIELSDDIRLIEKVKGGELDEKLNSTFEKNFYKFRDKIASDTVVEEAIYSKASQTFVSKSGEEDVSGEKTFTNGIRFNADFRISADGEAFIKSAGVPDFLDGLLGSGWKIWRDDSGKSHLTVDNITVRDSFTVTELLIERIKSVGGSIVVSAANGKISEIVGDEEAQRYRISFENGINTFVENDLLRCATFVGGSQSRSYWVRVSEADSNYVWVDYSEFTGSKPLVGDECVLMGNVLDESRQSFINITAANDGKPRIDIYNGVSGKTTDGALKTRIGALDGITDSVFPEDKQPNGYGLYSNNAWLHGTFILKNGDDVQTLFQILNGKVESTIDSIRGEVSQDKSILYNTAFTNGFDGWITEGASIFFTASGKFIFGNSKPLTYMQSGARLCREDDRAVLYVRNGVIKQRAETFVNKPTLTEVEEDGVMKVRPISVYYAFMYKASSDCECRVFMEGSTASINAKDEVFTPQSETITLYKSNGWQKASGELKYNGTGSFCVSISNGSGAYIYNLVLGTDSADILAARYRTLFAQSDRLITLSAAAFDKDDNALAESGLVIQSNFAEIFSGNDKVQASISTSVKDTVDGAISTIHLSASQISLEGFTTVNGGFIVDDDGNIEAQNANFENCSVVNSNVSGTFTSESVEFGNIVKIEENASAISMTAPLKIDTDTKKPVVGTKTRKIFTTSFGSRVDGEDATRYAWSEWYGEHGYMNIGYGYGYFVAQTKPNESSPTYQQWAHLDYDKLVVANETSTTSSQVTITAGAISILENGDVAELTTAGLTLKGANGRVRITDVGIEILDASDNVTKTILFSKILTS